MIYPLPTQTLKKKPKKKIPWVVLIILLLCGFIGFFFFYTHNLLYTSSDMTEPIVDFLFFVQDQKEVYFIRSNRTQKISYAVQMPVKSFEPIQAVSLDQSTPQGIYNSIEKLFGSADRSFWAIIQSSDFKNLQALSKRQNQVSPVPNDINTFIQLIQQIDVSFFEFVFFPKMQKLQEYFQSDNFNNRSAFRFFFQLKNFAYKITPITFLTKQPVTIVYPAGKQKSDASGDTAPTTVERFYLDDNSLKSIKEFMSQ